MGNSCLSADSQLSETRLTWHDAALALLLHAVHRYQRIIEADAWCRRIYLQPSIGSYMKRKAHWIRTEFVPRKQQLLNAEYFVLF